MQPKISVIIPIHNTEQFLQECLDSVSNQTLKEIEIICINDYSTDGSTEILTKHAKYDNRIKVINSYKNFGAGHARNLGLKVATGEYLAFLDSDDFYNLDFCEKLYNKATQTDADIVICPAFSYNNQDKTKTLINYSLKTNMLPQKDVFCYKDMPKYIFCFAQNWNWNKIFKNSFIKENNISFLELYRTNDLNFTCESLVLAKKITTINTPLVNYRTGLSTNSQSTNSDYPTDFYTAFKQLRKFLIKKNIYKEIAQSYVNWALNGCAYNISTQKDDESKKKLIQKIFPKCLFELDLIKATPDYSFDKYGYNNFKNYLDAYIFTSPLTKSLKYFLPFKDTSN